MVLGLGTGGFRGLDCVERNRAWGYGVWCRYGEDVEDHCVVLLLGIRKYDGSLLRGKVEFWA